MGPLELALVQSPGCQPDSYTVMHQHLHFVGAAVGEQVGVVGPGGAKDVHDARQRRFGSRSHVQRFDGQPEGLDFDHRSRSRSQPPHSLTSAAGQVITTCTAPQRTSMRMSPGGAGASAGAGKCTGTNPLTAGPGVTPGSAFGASTGSGLRGWISASRTQRRNRFALIPRDIATAAIDMPGCAASATALALNSSLCRRRRRPSPV